MKVTNTGNVAGKEVVQVYYGAPAGKLDKAAKELCGFAKTKELAPGESQSVTITFAVNNMASYDDMGVVCKSAYILEKGNYTIYVGNSVRSAEAIDYTYTLTEDVIVEQLTSYCGPKKLEKRLKADALIQRLNQSPHPN